jgi:hypothetical protein
MRVKAVVIGGGLLLAGLGALLAVLVASSALAGGTPPTTAPEPTVPETESTFTTTTTSSTTTTTTTTTPAPELVLPDSAITPGKLNPSVRQKTIKKTICKSGWTRTVRPPNSYTHALKLQQMILYGETGSAADYEEDHLIPLELGGAPRNPQNLWPEPHSQSKVSDPLETKLKTQVCKGILTLRKARVAIKTFKFANG